MGWFKNENPAPEAPAARTPMTFATSVPPGYVDSQGVWHATITAAEEASARRYVKEQIAKQVNQSILIRYGPAEDHVSPDKMLDDPDMRVAMAILGRGA